ncbi:MAG: hypothetical protein ACI4EI_01080 [Muricoprocola sp.]
MDKHDNNSKDLEDEYDYLKVSSAQDCTGLIPAGIQDDEEITNYEELYPFLPKAARPDKS